MLGRSRKCRQGSAAHGISSRSLRTPLPSSQLRSEQRLNADGSIWLRYAPLGAGPRCLHVKLNKQHVLGSPLRLDVSAGPVHPPACEVVGDGARLAHVHERHTFRIRAKDVFGNALTKGGEKYVVALERPGGSGAPIVPSASSTAPSTSATGSISLWVEARVVAAAAPVAP